MHSLLIPMSLSVLFCFLFLFLFFINVICVMNCIVSSTGWLFLISYCLYNQSAIVLYQTFVCCLCVTLPYGLVFVHVYHRTESDRFLFFSLRLSLYMNMKMTFLISVNNFLLLRSVFGYLKMLLFGDLEFSYQRAVFDMKNWFMNKKNILYYEINCFYLIRNCIFCVCVFNMNRL